MSATGTVYELVKKIGKNRLAQVELTPEMTLREDLGFDSLDLSELIVLTEDAFKIRIAPEEAQKVNTLAGMIAFVEKTCAA